MKKGKIFYILFVSLILVIITAFGCSQNSNSDNNNENIEVHGHWTVEVNNPDGSLVESYEFENALVSPGPERLAEFLAREYSVGGWMITAGNNTAADNPFYDPDSSMNEFAQIYEEGSTADPKPWRFVELTVSTESSITLILRGTAIAQRHGFISDVRTYVNRLAATLPPDDTYTGGYLFTQKLITEPIEVSGGQYIVFTVVISFS